MEDPTLGNWLLGTIQRICEVALKHYGCHLHLSIPTAYAGCQKNLIFYVRLPFCYGNCFIQTKEGGVLNTEILCHPCGMTACHRNERETK